MTYLQDDKNVVSSGALTNDLVISEEFNETETSDDDNCDIISDHRHLDESDRQRFWTKLIYPILIFPTNV